MKTLFDQLEALNNANEAIELTAAEVIAYHYYKVAKRQFAALAKNRAEYIALLDNKKIPGPHRAHFRAEIAALLEDGK